MSVKILHVEDNPANRMIVRDLLEFQGYQVVEVSDGEEALAAAEVVVGLGIVVTNFRRRSTTVADDLHSLKG